MLNDTQVQQFREVGYFILPELFSASEIDAVRERIDDFNAEHERHLAESGNQGISRANEIAFTNNLAQRDPVIGAFAADARFVEITTTLIGPDISLYWDQSVYKKPETRRDFPWHQDNGYRTVVPLEYVTCWTALEDATIENGTIWVMPGTHKDGVVEHKPTPIGLQCYFGDDPGTPVELPKGGTAVFSSLLFHRSGPNVSSRIRKAYITQYSPAGLTDQASGLWFNRLPIAYNGEQSWIAQRMTGREARGKGHEPRARGEEQKISSE